MDSAIKVKRIFNPYLARGGSDCSWSMQHSGPLNDTDHFVRPSLTKFVFASHVFILLYSVYSKGPCQEGELFSPSVYGTGECLVNQCPKDSFYIRPGRLGRLVGRQGVKI